MTELSGYTGRLLRVDLARGEAWAEQIEPEALRLTLGGVGLGTYLLLRYCPPGVDPLAAEAPLLFVTSPLVGTAVTTTAKYAVLAKSPLTGFIGDSLSSSHLALELKRTGYDALVISGACAGWQYLVVTDDLSQPVALRDASHLLGLGTWPTERAVRGELAGRGLAGARTAVIGPAGEHGVLYATISNDGRHAGRCGTGAVMGSKRLKAIAVRGRQPVRVAQPERLRAANGRLIERSQGPATAKYRQIGTPANLLVFDRLGVLPARNFSASTFEGSDALSGEELLRTHHAQRVGCASCTIGCEHLYKTMDAGPEVQTRLEYESLFALGPLIGVGDPNVVLRLARQCDELGLDTISAGGTIAWAMESAERGLLGGPEGADALRFGGAEALPGLLDAIAHRRGALGDLLADGSRRAAARLGGGSEAWAMHVKGLELPGYEPRGLKTLALGLAVTPRGACHNRISSYEVDFSGEVDRFTAALDRGQMAADSEDRAAVLDSLIVCKFIRKCFEDFYAEAAELYEHVTGWATSGEDLREAGKRINLLKKLFNVREGWTRADDTLPPRVLDEPLADGAGAGERLTRAQLDLMIGGYYDARGWTVDGKVPDEALRELAGLDVAVAGLPAASG
ncbi:MAG: Tungsten-containing aldehyde:ferredoxin oxidoreductase [uncultured Chloroflexi bacterium]|uniref:Tungsten-containing aldehyde:ferredoxin oxidoreductase n=1 Tax=uncultured Chloroflexota bacterium TaxID=166587 RepID=A0A6J4JP51_9CHLR|nr:MAG: Tungsten-containing aldehyde:ferredoxin oxidoreductase [uncultured Chloroflexota bacterium]